MTVKEMLSKKYQDALKNMNAVTWNNLKSASNESGKHIAQIMYMGIEVTANDIRDNGGWNGELFTEISAMRKAKLIASNANRNGNGITKYWLTDKGWKAINKDHAIC